MYEFPHFIFCGNSRFHKHLDLVPKSNKIGTKTNCSYKQNFEILK
ncbi:hypothetical protein LEP1GSC008_3318 [Leptospira kirschneri serovar Bulgarica str. Nikolaevo]|uniref:Uncharacterized protein n=1 Tax=Leptospira kirschneri serovar Bulgarica str. Nikolaevo TaxID=1240687 RepID=M6F599_9LEPT|nr:hypothetical protein LEP1GSC008_3318 [Leptospira kirschneri serovar Bulgarica str. Nikolaevo]